MKDEKFIIINLIKNLIKDFDQYLTNFPHKEIELKHEIMITSYELLKRTHEANSSYDLKKRLDLQDKIVSYIKFLDFLVNLCYEKKIINSKKYTRFGENLDYLLQQVYAWRKNTGA